MIGILFFVDVVVVWTVMTSVDIVCHLFNDIKCEILDIIADQ